MPFLLLNVSGRAIDLGIISVVEAIPSLVILLFFPNFLDKHKPLQLLFICRCLFVLINISLAVIVYYDLATPTALYIVAFIGGVVWGIAFPASKALLPLYIRKALIVPTNSLLSLVSGVAMALVPIFAGYLVFYDNLSSGLALAFIVDAVSVFLSFGFLLALKRSKSMAVKNDKKVVLFAPKMNVGTKSIRDYFQSSYLDLHYFLAATSFFIVFGPINIYLTYYVVESKSVGHLYLYMSIMIGALLASTITRSVNSQIDSVMKQLQKSWFWVFLALITFLTTDNLMIGFVVFSVLACAQCFNSIKTIAWLQKNIHYEKIGVAMAIYSALVLMAPPVASTVAGAAIDYYGLQITIILNSIIVLSFLLISVVLTNNLRTMRH